MSNYEPTAVQWVCEHCYIHLVNGDCTQPDDCHPVQCWPLHPSVSHPMYLFRGMQVTPGMTAENHQCGRENGAVVDECDCEGAEFSWAFCDGCNSNLGGSRYAATGWIPVTA